MAYILLHDCLRRSLMLILRVVLGLTMAAHGYNKFFGKGGLSGTAGWFDSMGMKPGIFHARVAATTEMAAGLGLAVGLLTPDPRRRLRGADVGRGLDRAPQQRLLHRQGGLGVQPDPRCLRGRRSRHRRGQAQPRLRRCSARPGSTTCCTAGGACVIALVLGLAGGIGQLLIFFRPPGQAERLRFVRRADTHSHGVCARTRTIGARPELEHVLV